MADPDRLVQLFLREARPRVCCDIDGILAFFLEGMCQALNARFETQYRPDATHHYWVESWLPAEQATWLTACFHEPSFYATLAPDFGGIACLNAFHRAGMAIWIVSDRPVSVRAATEDWLTRWRVPFDTLRLGPGSKAAVARAARADGRMTVCLDDDPRKATELPNACVTLVCPRRPFTPHDLPGALVIDTWDDLLGRFGIAPTIEDVPQLVRRAAA